MKKATHRTGYASVLTAEEAIARFHVSDGYISSLKVPQPGGSEVRFCEAVAIKEGVWNGLFEKAEVLQDAAGSLLGRYVMLDHPEEGTEPAWCDTAMGQIIGVEAQGENAEIHCLLAMWVNRMPPELTQRIDNGKKIGVSVGFVQFFKEEEGYWEDKPYHAVATKIHYTHLAIVPVGACSVEDGCSAQIISQNQDAEAGTTAKKGEEESKLKSGAAESKEVHQAVIVDAPVSERPPPLFKDPDEMLAFTNQAMAIDDNPELKARQLDTAFDFVMNTITDFGWTIYSAEDQSARAAAMATFIARAAAAWKTGDPLFSPPGAAVAASASQSTRSRSWRGDDIPMSEEKHEKKEEGATITTTLYKYPVLTQTDDGKPQISWNSTEDQAKFDAGVKDYETAFGGMLNQFNETLSAMDAKAKKGDAADAIARGLLIGGLKTAMPKLTDASLEKYKGMELDSLAGIVTDLGQAVTPVAAPGMEGEGAPAPGSLAPEAKKESHAPTQVDLQKLGDKKKFTFMDAARRVKAETGIDL